MHELQQLAYQLDRRLRANRRTTRRGDHERDAWLHVLGRGMPFIEAGLHGPAEFV